MKLTTPLRTLAAVALASGLSACGGGGDFGGRGTDDSQRIEPISGIDHDGLAKAGVSPNEPTRFTSMASVNNGKTDEDLKSEIIFNERVDGHPHQLIVHMDTDGDGNFNSTYDTNSRPNMNAEHGNYINERGEPGIINTVEKLGPNTSEEVLVAYNEENTDLSTVVYVPRDGSSDVYAGGYANNSHAQGYHGVFGRRTSSGEIADVEMSERNNTMNGKVAYSGRAAANVTGFHEDGTEFGLYLGSSKGQVDFRDRTVRTEATLSRERQLSAGTDVATIRTSGTYGADGRIDGRSEITGLDESAVRGQVNGALFGPNAETLGQTFTGENAKGGVAGHMVLNQE